ncbi:hypothetical protein GC194_07280 [bacterium]|nr:hypothetical protein [bacterium]
MKNISGIIVLFTILITSCTMKNATDQFVDCMGVERFSKLHSATTVLDSLLRHKYQTNDLIYCYSQFGKSYFEQVGQIDTSFTNDLTEVILTRHDTAQVYFTEQIQDNEYEAHFARYYLHCLENVRLKGTKAHSHIIQQTGGFNYGLTMDLFARAHELDDALYLEIAKIEYIQILLYDS